MPSQFVLIDVHDYSLITASGTELFFHLLITGQNKVASCQIFNTVQYPAESVKNFGSYQRTLRC